MIKMPGIERLHRAMQAVSETRTRFRLQYNHLEFECVFLVDVQPFELAFASIGHGVFCVLAVRSGYHVTPYLGDAYGPLLKALKNTGDSGRALDPREFLSQLDARLPAHIRPGSRPSATDIIRVYRDVEEAEKVHFVGTILHRAPGRTCSKENREKTRRLMGQDAHDWCVKHRVSTKWSDVAPTNAPQLPWRSARRVR